MTTNFLIFLPVLRVVIAQDLLVDIYYNAENGRQDDALIRRDERGRLMEILRADE